EETSYFHFALLWGEDIENVAIVGKGTIDSNRKDRSGPKTIALKRCRQITLRDITIRNAGNYAISLLGTDFVNIDGVTIFSSYCDGIDPDCCHDVRISNCSIESWDDAIVPKTSYSLGYHRSTENITVTNCVLATSCNAFKLGTESGGDFKNITVSNCAMIPYKSNVNYREPTPPISGISLISVDGSHIDGINITNISMEGVCYPIFVRLGNRGRDLKEPVPGTIDHVNISHITATKALIGCLIIGHPGRPIENLNLENIQIECVGGGVYDPALPDIEEAMQMYPSAGKFHDLPTFGVYGRHVSGLDLEKFRLSVDTNDTRNASLFEDVSNLRIDSWEVQGIEGATAMIRCDNVWDALIRGCRPSSATSHFLEVSGAQSHGIAVTGNDLSGLKEPCKLHPDTPNEAVQLKFNL
ncbi:MAG: right-handed parallel beta-helix repeat-containing protein, partial [Candidatus Omnitrophica bacterium]|nr:right-handed parallel beta-helix repeat-containing protein [Candidatus Omnitrophota bacterium]